MRKITAIGVDIGGTSMKLGLVDARGKVLLRRVVPTGRALGRVKTLGLLVSGIRELALEAKRRGLRVVGAGIGAPGPIDVEKGLVYFFPNLPGWKNTPLKKILEKKLKMPVALDNDANAMALGEFRFGAGRGSKSVIALTLGTGVGGGMIVDGRLFHGPAYSAAEIGHLTLNENGPLCGCGNRGCLETYVGNGYFVREVERRLDEGRKSVLSALGARGRRELTPLLIAEAARKGDALSKEMWEETGAHLGTALSGLVNILNPEKIILGGGIAQNKDLLFAPTIRALKKKAFPIAARSVKVVPARLGVDAGLVGAATLVLDHSEKSR